MRFTPQEELERFLTRSFRIAPGIPSDGPLLVRCGPDLEKLSELETSERVAEVV